MTKKTIITIISCQTCHSAKIFMTLANIFNNLFSFFFTAMDPLFWVAHGAMERTFQKAVLAGLFTDMIYDTNNHCSGHNYNSTKYWLKGFYFPNETISAELLTNEELTIMLDPSTAEYPYVTNFIYDTASFDWCDGSDAWFEV